MQEKDLHYFVTRIINPDLNWIIVSLRSPRHVVHGRDGYTGLHWTDHSVSDTLASRLEEWRDNLWYKYKDNFPENGKQILDEFFDILIAAEAKLPEGPDKDSVLKRLWELAKEMGKYLELDEYVSQKVEEVKKKAAEIRERDNYLREKVREAISKESKSQTISHKDREKGRGFSNIKPRQTSSMHVKRASKRTAFYREKRRKRKVLPAVIGGMTAILVAVILVSWFATGNPTQVLEDAISGHFFKDAYGPQYRAYPVNKTFSYCLRGQRGNISITLYQGVVEHMRNIPRSVYSSQMDKYWEIMVDRLIEDKVQDEYLTPLVAKIQSLTADPNDQLRIAVSLVQRIPYDMEAYRSDSTYMKSPYEVLYYNKGVCSEKSFLLAYLLKKLGYGVILLEYKEENHMAVAVKCPSQYANFWYEGTGYCFIETTIPTIITYIPDTYIGSVKLKSTPRMIFVSDGREFTGVGEEYKDAKEYKQLEELARRNNNVLPQREYLRWQYLTNKYCLLDNENSSLWG